MLKRMFMAIMVVLGSLKIELTILPNATKNMYPGGWGWCIGMLKSLNDSAKPTESQSKRYLDINGILLKIMRIAKENKIIESILLLTKGLYLSKILNTPLYLKSIR